MTGVISVRVGVYTGRIGFTGSSSRDLKDSVDVAESEKEGAKWAEDSVGGYPNEIDGADEIRSI